MSALEDLSDSNDDDMNPDVKNKDINLQTHENSNLNMESIRESADQLLIQEEIDKSCAIKIMKLVQNMERLTAMLLQEKDKEIHQWKIQCKEHIVQERMSVRFNEILTTFTQRMNLLEEKVESCSTKTKRR